MDSHFLNTFHQTRFRPIGHDILHMENESLSSDSSCNLISPEYSQARHSVDRSNGAWCQNQTTNITRSGEELREASYGQEVTNVEDDDVKTSTPTTIIIDDDTDLTNDIEDTSLVESRDYDIDDVETSKATTLIVDDDTDVTNDIEDTSLVEGRDYDIDDVKTLTATNLIVDDDTDITNDIEDSSLVESRDYDIDDVETSKATTLIVDDDTDVTNDVEDTSLVEGRDYDIILVYEVNPEVYDVSDSDENVIEIVDYSTSENDSEAESVNDYDSSYREGNDQDQNTISRDGLDNNLDIPIVLNVDEYFNNKEHKLDTDGPVVKDVDEYFIKSTLPERSGENEPVNDEVTTDNADMLRIEEIKRYLLEDMTYTEFRHIHNCRSVPQSPKHLKTCISLEDLDLSEFALDNDKDKSENPNEIDDIPQLLTDEEVSSFLITNTETKPKSKSEENVSSYLGAEIERPLESTSKFAPPVVDLPLFKRTCTRTNETKVLDFCTQKQPRHDHCSSKKLHSLPKLKARQSLPKPEMLSSRITKSRHRSCKNKKVVYHFSSDDENDNNAKNKKGSKPDAKKKTNVKSSVKPPGQSNFRTKLSPPRSAPDSLKDKSNSSEIFKSPSNNYSDNDSQNSNGSIKLIIKNKSEVILNFDKNIEKCKNSASEKTNNEEQREQYVKQLDRSKSKNVKELETVTTVDEMKQSDRSKSKIVNNVETVITVKEKEKTLFSNKQDAHIPQALQPKKKKKQFDDENKCLLAAAIKKAAEQSQKKKKISLQEYKLRRSVCSKNSSATVSPEATFPDMHRPLHDNVAKYSKTQTTPNHEQKFFDPIKEASRKILMNTKKRKAEAMKKRDEDIMSKISKQQNLRLLPLISDAEMMKIVENRMSQPVILPVPIEKPQLSGDYEEIILVSIGTNTDENMFSHAEKPVVEKIIKTTSPSAESKSTINFKIKKSDHVLKHNVFDNVRRYKRSPLDEKKHSNIKIDKERYKDITATLKSVGKQVETKTLSNSLFASIQDVVMKKAPEEAEKHDGRHKLKFPQEKRGFKFAKTTIVREYDPKAEHGEDKVILHLGKHRSKPRFSSMVIQTDSVAEFAELAILAPTPKERPSPASRKRNDSDMSLSSDESPSHKSDERQVKQTKAEDRLSKPKEVRAERTETKEKRSRSKYRYDSNYRRRSRSLSCRRRKRLRSRSRSRSRSCARYSKYRRSDSPYIRKRRPRSPYHKRRSPSVRRDRLNRSKSRSRPTVTRLKSPMAKKMKLDEDRKNAKSVTPPLRKPTVSESSDSSSSSSSGSSSSSSGSSSSSNSSRNSRGSCSSYKRDKIYVQKGYRSYNPDKESNTPVDECRVVFVGRLEKDITKLTLKNQFSKFGHVMEVRLHSKPDGTRYGFVTYQRARDAWSAVEASSTFPQYDVGFGGRRASCRQSYADLDGLGTKYTESAFRGQAAPRPIRRYDIRSFKDMLLETKNKLSQRKMKRPDRQSPWH